MGWLLAALGPLMIGWSLTGTASAAEEAEVNTLLQEAWTISGGDLVVCAAGDEAEAIARRLVKGAEWSQPPAIMRIPVLGKVEDEADRVRTESERSCAIWIRPAEDEGQWTAGRVGPCAPPASAAIPVVAVEPSLDADPAPSPPVAGPAPTAPQPQADGPWKLVMADLDPSPADVDGVDWHIVDERGVSWSTYRFAETVGDVEMVGTLDQQLRVAAKERKALFWSGIGAMAISPIPLVFAGPGTYERNQDLAWTSLFLAATGGMTFAIHKRGVQSTKRRQLRPAHYYSRADSEALIGAHNIRVDLMRDVANAASANSVDGVEGGEAQPAPATPEEDSAPVTAPATVEDDDAGSSVPPADEVPADEVPADDAESGAAIPPPAEAPPEDAPPADEPQGAVPVESPPAEEAPAEAVPADEPAPAPAPPAAVEEAAPDADAAVGGDQ